MWLACSGESRSTASNACFTTLPLSMGDATRTSPSTIIPLRSDQAKAQSSRALADPNASRDSPIARKRFDHAALRVGRHTTEKENAPRRQDRRKETSLIRFCGDLASWRFNSDKMSLLEKCVSG